MTASALPFPAGRRLPADRVERIATSLGIWLTSWASRRRARRSARVAPAATSHAEGELAEFRLRVGVGMR
ncbi:hypothetical protein [Agromyces sp. SYSU T00194]|uniref:hypothetical protein n=1 Tax=Agromyces chitinivorans TaxID=3158560 RepID=UPI0033909E36